MPLSVAGNPVINRRNFLGAAGAAATVLAMPNIGSAQGAATKVRIATLPSIILFPTYVAQDLGVFKANGVDVELVVGRGGSELIQLMVSGAVDVANAGVEHILKLRETGLDAKVIAVQEKRYITELVVNNKHKDTVKSVKDLSGMTIGISGIGSGSHVCARYILRNAGLDPDLDVSFVAVGSPATQVDAFRNGQIEALMAYDPAQSILKYEAEIAYPVWSGVAGDPPALFQDFAMEALGAKAEWIEKNKAAAMGVAKANMEAIDLILKRDPRVIDVYQKMFPGVARAVLERSIEEHLGAFSPVLTEQGIKNVSEYGKFAGVTTRDFTMAETVPEGFAEIWSNWKSPV
jgi:NitT/TauT family transport system substrate-binding protein